MKNKFLLFLLIAIIGFIVISCNVGKYFQQQYFKNTYHPVCLKKINYSQLPNEYHINGVPCISYQNAYCASAALQMVAEQKGNIRSINYINWAMGFTYSFTFFEKYSFALPYYDPETGYVNASKHLGLKRNYLVSSDSTIFIDNLKKQISLNIPLRIALNSSTLHKNNGFSPHSVLAIGYSKDSIYYYETGGKDRRLNNYKGEKVDISTFLNSVRNISISFGYPWLYNMSSFDSCNQDKDLKKVWARNGKYLMGQSHGQMSIGSKAIKNFSEFIKNTELKEWQFNQFIMVLDMGIYTRNDNSNFIRTNFTSQNFQKIADMFSQSGSLFKDAKQAMIEKDKNTVVKKLNEISEVEYSIGKLMTEKDD